MSYGRTNELRCLVGAGLQDPALHLCNTRGSRATPFQWKDISEPWNTKGSELQQLGENQGCTNIVAPLVNRYTRMKQQQHL